MFIYCTEQNLEKTLGEYKFKNLTINFYDYEPGKKTKLNQNKNSSKDPFTFFISTLLIGILFLQNSNNQNEFYKLIIENFQNLKDKGNVYSQKFLNKNLILDKVFYPIFLFIIVYLLTLIANYNCNGWKNYFLTSLDITIVYCIIAFCILLCCHNGGVKHFDLFFYSTTKNQENIFIKFTNIFQIEKGITLTLLIVFTIFVLSSMLIIFLNIYKIKSLIRILFLIMIIYIILMSDLGGNLIGLFC